MMTRSQSKTMMRKLSRMMTMLKETIMKQVELATQMKTVWQQTQYLLQQPRTMRMKTRIQMRELWTSIINEILSKH